VPFYYIIDEVRATHDPFGKRTKGILYKFKGLMYQRIKDTQLVLYYKNERDGMAKDVHRRLYSSIIAKWPVGEHRKTRGGSMKLILEEMADVIESEAVDYFESRRRALAGRARPLQPPAPLPPTQQQHLPPQGPRNVVQS
jgi:hypothetical protein